MISSVMTATTPKTVPIIGINDPISPRTVVSIATAATCTARKIGSKAPTTAKRPTNTMIACFIGVDKLLNQVATWFTIFPSA